MALTFWNGAPSIEERMIAVDRRPSGFDYIRIVLALGIVAWHTIVTSYGYDTQLKAFASPYRPIILLLLPMFFALSGFLVSGSLQRCRTLISFAGLRVLRIIPALAFETVLSALLLGAVLTTLPLQTYFTSPVFFHYFLNIIGNIHYILPGVIEHNPFPDKLNGQLWTVPFEMECYLVLSILAFVTIAKRGWLMLGVSVLIFPIIIFATQVLKHHGVKPELGAFPGGLLVACFLCGVALFVLRETVRFSLGLGLASILACVVLLSLPFGDYLAVLPITYLTVWIGMQNPAKLGLLQKGDYSYGVFLFGFPIQQAFMTLGPWTHHWWINFLVCAPLAFLVGIFSWHFVEKPTLDQRKWLIKLEDRAIALGLHVHRRATEAFPDLLPPRFRSKSQ